MTKLLVSMIAYVQAHACGNKIGCVNHAEIFTRNVINSAKCMLQQPAYFNVVGVFIYWMTETVKFANDKVSLTA